MAKGQSKGAADVAVDSSNRRRSARNLKREGSEGNGDEKKTQRLGKRALTPPPSTASERRRSKRAKPNDTPEQEKGEEEEIKSEIVTPVSPKVKREASTSPRKQSDKPKLSKDKEADLQAKKLKSYGEFAAVRQSPFPAFSHPSPEECKLAHKILSSLHGERRRPEDQGKKTTAPAQRAGCGDSPSVLDALIRTILSQNTSDKNSTRAKLSMDKTYGRSDEWAEIVKGGQAKLQKSIESGGLAVVKSKVILSILDQTYERYGKYSLDHMFEQSDEEAMREMISFKGVGPKTASCVLLFCLRRASFAVDTHVHRITGLLGWRPADASRDQTHAHLDAKIPDEDKYGLHVLLVKHGKECEECKAGGKNLGRCELRKAFKKGKIKGEAGETAKEEELDNIKKEEEEED
ncbi:DNA glycosylase [Xylariaceae sp. FL1019]|nr:DNA glycosylase [Xylariaceae sp. FL1019]